MARLLAAPVMAVLVWQQAVRAQEPAAMAPPANVGFQAVDFTRGNGNVDPPAMTVSIWYPTQAAPEACRYNDSYKTTTRIAVESPPTSGAHPLVIFSHGYGGAGISSIYLTEYLAAHGFIVAAPDHEDKNYIVRTRPGTPLKSKNYSLNVIRLARSGGQFDHAGYAYRSQDVSQTIDDLLSLNQTDGSPFRGAINPEAIGVMGHSLGGYTALCVCGMRPAECDPRIKAALLLTGGVFMFQAKDYRSLRVPVMFMFGEAETARWRALFLNDKMADTRRAYDHCAPPKYMIEIKEANHFSFCQATFDSRWPGLGKKAKPIADVINTYSLAFLRRWLLGDSQADAALNARSPSFVLYEKQVPAEGKAP
jgi:predicted dienelactone hydrolase